MKIIKIIFEAVIIFIILTLLLIAAVVFLVKFKSTSILGETLKDNIIKYPSAVYLINLNQPGDAKFAYIQNDYPLEVRVFYTDGYVPDKEIKFWIEKMLSETTGGKGVIEIQKTDIVSEKEYDNNSLNIIRKELLTSFNFRPVLNIIYLSAYSKKSTNVGIALHRDTIYIFKDTLNKLSERKEVLKQLEESTLMHEWGHLLGLSHQKNDDCIMSEKVEVYDNPLGHKIATEYCQETLSELELLKRER